MSVTPQNFIEIADELISDASPIKVRAAVSRGYYGAYHAAKEFHEQLPAPGMLSSGGGVHEALIQRLENPSFQRADERWWLSKSIGLMLRRVRDARTHADYRLGEPLSKDKAETTIAEAKIIIEKSSV